jgi:hypothetical protein
MFKVEIETVNDAFKESDTGSEVARILRELAMRVDEGGLSGMADVAGILRDGNGARVGDWHFSND